MKYAPLVGTMGIVLILIGVYFVVTAPDNTYLALGIILIFGGLGNLSSFFLTNWYKKKLQS